MAAKRKNAAWRPKTRSEIPASWYDKDGYLKKKYRRIVSRLNPGVKMRKAPKGWMKAKAVRVVRRGGRQVVEVKR